MGTLDNYLSSARLIARAGARATLPVLADMLRVRFRHGIGPYLFCYFSVDGRQPEDWSEYIVHEKFNPVQRRLNPDEARLWAEDKYQFYARCERAGLPAPRVWGLITNEQTDPSHTHPRLHQDRDWQDLVDTSGVRQFFLKPSHGAHGDGAFLVTVMDGRYRFGEQEGGIADLIRHALERLPPGNSYLVQSRLSNAASMAPVMSQGLGTIRLVTARIQGHHHEIAACLRISVGESITDNFRSGRSANLVAPVDLGSGALGEGLCSIGGRWPDIRAMRTHPSTGQVITGFILPQWQAVRELARKAHEEFSEMAAIGWDISITDQGPLIIEANHSWSLNLLQLAHRRGFRTHLEKIIGPLTEVLP